MQLIRQFQYALAEHAKHLQRKKLSRAALKFTKNGNLAHFEQRINQLGDISAIAATSALRDMMAARRDPRRMLMIEALDLLLGLGARLDQNVRPANNYGDLLDRNPKNPFVNAVAIAVSQKEFTYLNYMLNYGASLSSILAVKAAMDSSPSLYGGVYAKLQKIAAEHDAPKPPFA